jgi:para-nitrobenzyl esterase
MVMRKTRRVACAALAAALVAVPALAAEVRVTGGMIRGLDEADGSSLYFGIPYAAPPVGKLRWRAPAPVVPWSGVRDATQTPPTCLQHDEGWNHGDALAGAEDCLTLSIHAPSHKPGERLPVMFWIHGGSNLAGSGAGTARSLITQRGLVLVSIEYRLGVFGFLAASELSAESRAHVSGNYALLDQVAALRWVSRNIARFGGDPGNVTIAGQSAGGYDVAVLLLTPLARGLFHKAIAQSPAPLLQPPSPTLAEAERVGAQFPALLKVPAGQAGLQALRALPAGAILAAQDRVVPPGDPRAPPFGQAIVDGHLLPRSPARMLAEGTQAQVPLLIGSNRQEFGLADAAGTARDFLQREFGARAPRLLQAYGLSGAADPAPDPELGNIGMQVATDVVFRCPASELAALQAKALPGVWRYQFGFGARGSNLPPAHSAELGYEFDAAPEGASYTRWPPVQAYWANFVRAGDPNGPGLPRWPALGPQRHYLDFTPRGLAMGQDLRGDFCRLLAVP